MHSYTTALRVEHGTHIPEICTVLVPHRTASHTQKSTPSPTPPSSHIPQPDPCSRHRSYDIDRSNTIEAAEFVDFMTHEFLAPALPPPGVLCELSSSGNVAWDIPR